MVHFERSEFTCASLVHVLCKGFRVETRRVASVRSSLGSCLVQVLSQPPRVSGNSYICKWSNFERRDMRRAAGKNGSRRNYPPRAAAAEVVEVKLCTY